MYNLRAIILDVLSKRRTDNPLYVRRAHWATDASKCSRELFYNWKKETKSNPIGTGTLLKFEMGNYSHRLIYDLMDESPLLEGRILETELKWYSKNHEVLEYPITCKIDRLYMDSDGTETILEIKSSFGRNISNQFKFSIPEEYLKQIGLYLVCQDKWKKATIFTIARDTGYTLQFSIYLDSAGLLVYDELKVFETEEPEITTNIATGFSPSKIIEKFVLLEKHLKENSVPKREYNAFWREGKFIEKFQKNNVIYKSDWQCKFCSWRNYCWKEDTPV